MIVHDDIYKHFPHLSYFYNILFCTYHHIDVFSRQSAVSYGANLCGRFDKVILLAINIMSVIASFAERNYEREGLSIILMGQLQFSKFGRSLERVKWLIALENYVQL